MKFDHQHYYWSERRVLKWDQMLFGTSLAPRKIEDVERESFSERGLHLKKKETKIECTIDKHLNSVKASRFWAENNLQTVCRQSCTGQRLQCETVSVHHQRLIIGPLPRASVLYINLISLSFSINQKSVSIGRQLTNDTILWNVEGLYIVKCTTSRFWREEALKLSWRFS